MKIFHTSDWHLGAKLHDTSREDEQRAFLDWLIGQMQERKPDLLLVAGDIFDTGCPGAATVELYHKFLSRIRRDTECRKVILTGGNHDSKSQLGTTRQILELLDISVTPSLEDHLEKQCLYLEKDGKIEVAIAAMPFVRESEAANLARKEMGDRPREELAQAGYAMRCQELLKHIQDKAPGTPVVMTGHCYLKGAVISDDTSERSRSAQNVGGLDGLDLNTLPNVAYLALGHLHKPQKVAGLDHVRYSGAPIPMSFAEACDKQILEIEISRENPLPVVREIPIPPFCSVQRLWGKKEEIEDRLLPLLSSKTRTYMEIKVTEGQGSLEEWWKKIDDYCKGNKLLTVVTRDGRPRKDLGSGLASLEGERLEVQAPRDVAERRIREENFTEEEVSGFMGMIDECIKAATGADISEKEGEQE